ncbi:MAG TPA: ATP-dependent DNA helicase RecQ [Lentimicrobium sp.]|nr:ATP-dependent DNA helicase RecQ [Lentimicrobium sp.]
MPIYGDQIHDVLRKYWGFSEFRPLQEEIIRSVLDGKDTLALLSTGGGKSLCFQVPGLCLPGMTLVITPLIALMKDQVERLRKHQISAEAIYSGMNPRENELALNHVIHSQAKFLYISPERLASDYFREILNNIKLSLIVVDEAHCISQWGYDFRPPYLKIAEIRPYFPSVNVLALTATATPSVAKDIQEKLNFRQPNVFTGSFERRNLVYVVNKEENKYGLLLRVLKGVAGSSIIYVRNRKKTRETAEFLQRNNISADYYHAGLSAKDREKKQNEWVQGYTRVIVCTNAFGMGIDKPDVRSVIHLDLPDSIEAYFQEAGRAGRDGKKSYPILIYHESDIIDAEQNIELNYPDPEFIRNVYRLLGNYYELAPGTGRELTVDLDINAFSGKYGFKPVIAFNALKFIEKEGYISMNEAMYAHSRFVFNVDKSDLYKFQVENAGYDILIKTMQRSYGGSFTEPVPIFEDELARRLETSEQVIRDMLKVMDKVGVISYFPQNDKPQLTFISELVDAKNLSISPENYKKRKEAAISRMQSMISYAKNTDRCRSQVLIGYFGQKVNRCGVCDVCLQTNKETLSELEYNRIVDIIKPLLELKEMSTSQMQDACDGFVPGKVTKTVSWLLDNGNIRKVGNDLYKWNT